MDDKLANIDLVFRNGLKDYEVLPPADVWDNIHPGIKTGQRPFILMRVAAAAAIIFSMSFLAYRWSKQIPAINDTAVAELNEEALSPVVLSNNTRSLKIVEADHNSFRNYDYAAIGNNSGIAEVRDILTGTPPEAAILMQAESLGAGNTKPLQIISMVNQESSTAESISLEDYKLSVPSYAAPAMTERWSISAMASPTYYSRFSSGASELSKQLNTAERSSKSYSGGVTFAYRVNKRISIQSGLIYASVGQEIEGVSSYAGFQVFDNTKGDHNFELLTTSGTVIASNPDVFINASGPEERVLTTYTKDVFDPLKSNLQQVNNSMLQSFSYLELPFILRYKVIDKSIDINLIGGVSYNLLINNSVSTTFNGEKYPIGKTEGLNPLTVSSSFGMGVEYNFTSKLSLNLEPTFRYYLNPLENMDSGFHPYSFGIFSGVCYKF